VKEIRYIEFWEQSKWRMKNLRLATIQKAALEGREGISLARNRRVCPIKFKVVTRRLLELKSLPLLQLAVA
jgi:hypothetical protein